MTRAWIDAVEIIGSLASIAGLLLMLHVYQRELAIGADVRKLKQEEEAWHAGEETKTRHAG